jgi:hypothetical protein
VLIINLFNLLTHGVTCKLVTAQVAFFYFYVFVPVELLLSAGVELPVVVLVFHA